MSKPLRTKQILKEQRLNTILLESYTEAPKETVLSGSPILSTFEINITEENKENANGRIYPTEVWEQPGAFKPGGNYLDENGKLKPLSLLGNLDHPVDDQLEVFLENAGLAWAELNRDDEGVWRGKAHVLDTPKGKIINTFLKYAKEFGGGEQIGVSTRADGTTELHESQGQVYERVVPEGFELIAIDFVYNPSVFTANSPTLLESKKRQRTLLESVQNLAKEDKENKDYYNKVVSYMKEQLGESASLNRAKQVYINELKEQEYRLHQAIYEIEQMSDEEFIANEISENLSRDQFLAKIKKEHRNLIKEIDREEGVLEEMTKDKTTETIEETKETLEEQVTETIEDETTEDETTEEALEEQTLTEEEVEEDEVEEDEVDEEIEDEEEIEVDEEEEIEEVDEVEEDEVKEDEITLESIHSMLTQVMADIEEMRTWFFDVDDIENEFELGLEDEIVDEEFDEDFLEVTEEDLENMTDEELDILYQLAEDSIGDF